MRLNRFLAHAGLGSRRKVEALILAGRVQVNGRLTKELHAVVDTEADRVEYDGQVVRLPEAVLFRYYKPRGVVSSLKDERGREDLAEVAKMLPRGCKPVGRLDRNSEGLLLWTNDGAWHRYLSNPSFAVEKEYHVTVQGDVAESQLSQMREMSALPDGTHLRYQVEISELQRRSSKTVLQVVLREGKKNQIRVMCSAVDLKVLRLVRVAEAGINIYKLKPGQVERIRGTALKGFILSLEARSS